MPVAGLVSLAEIRELVAEAIRPAHFFLGPEIHLEAEHLEREEISWEIFQGRLLAPAQTRERRCFESWNLYLRDANGRSEEPILSVKWDTEADCLQVVRSIYSHVHEGYHAGDNVYLSRETRQWLRELVASIALGSDRAALGTVLGTRLFQAVVGLSRLPLHSVEAPLPAFSLGQLAYFPQPNSPAVGPARSVAELIDRTLTPNRPWLQKAKVLEFLLRAAPVEQLADAARWFASRWAAIEPAPLPALFRALFQEVSLSPYTDFVARTLAFLRLLEEQGTLTAAEHVDFLSALLRQLVRHLTAYDLVVFHHRGANYPDALLLDAALREYLDLVERHPALFAPTAPKEAITGRLRRRALRQALLLRCQYEGHDVPDAPTSPGENARVLPPSFPRVPDEQIADPSKRRRQLFTNDPLLARLSDAARDRWRDGIADLEQLAELRELGMALFLDRPLGAFQKTSEPNRTLLLSHEAFSPTVAQRRLRYLAENLGLLSDQEKYHALRDALISCPALGIPLTPRPGPTRPGVVSLADALKAAPDFVLLRTTRRATADFLAHFDLAPLAARIDLDYLASDRRVLIVGGDSVAGQQPGTLLVYDDHLALRLEWEIDAAHPAGGLRLRRTWDSSTAAARDWSGQNVYVRAVDFR